MKGIHQSNIIIRMMQWISIDKMKRSSWFELIFWIANSKMLWILKVKGTCNDFESLFCILVNSLRNKQTVLIDIALLQCTCQVYTNIAVFKVNTMIIISYPRGSLFTSDISIKLSVINGGKPPHLYLVCKRQMKWKVNWRHKRPRATFLSEGPINQCWPNPSQQLFCYTLHYRCKYTCNFK